MKTLTLTVAFLTTLSLMAAKTEWTGGGVDNKWSTPQNWSNGVPTAESGEQATVPAGDWEIEVDGDCQFFIFALEEGSGTVTLTGSGTLRHSQTATGSSKKIDVATGRELVIDGPNVQPWSYEQTGTVRLKNGSFKVSTKGCPLTGNAQFLVCGGKFLAPDASVTVGNSASFRLIEGEATIDIGKMTVNDGGQFLFLGGRLATPSESIIASTQSCFLPPKGADLVGLSEFDLNMREPRDYAFYGTVCATNGGTLSFTGNSNASIPMDVAGRGAVSVSQMRYIGAKSGNVVNFDLGELNLGAGGISPSSHYGNLHFLNGIHFGALADWGTAGEVTSYYHLHGPVEFDTQGHNITFGSARLEDINGLKVTGGGMVALVNVGASPSHVDTFEVADNTALTLAGGVGGIKAAKVKLGNGAMLTLDIGKGQFLDASVSVCFGTGAKIQLILPTELDPNQLYPVYFAPVGNDPELALFELPDEISSGWRLEKRENTVYLTDGTVHPGTDGTTSKYCYWNGGQDGNYSNTGNWYDGDVGNGTSKIAYFSGDRNTVIENDVSDMQTRYMEFAASSGPYTISGKSCRFIYPTATDEGYRSLNSSSKFPVTIKSVVWKKNHAGSFVINAAQGGPVSLVGGNYTEDSVCPLYFSGDVRLGGTWALSDISAGSADHVCASVLTVLPEANVTVHSAASIKDREFSYCVANDGVCTFNGTELRFATAENTHFIDGMFKVACPFAAVAKQTFRGAGTVKLLALADAAGGIELAGGITCVPGDWKATTPVYCRDTPSIKTECAVSLSLGDEGRIELEPHAVLTIDTTDGDLVLDTPVVGGGDIVKAGSGKLVFNCGGSVVDTLLVNAGTVGVGPNLVAAAETGYVPFLTAKRVVGELTIKDAKIKAVDNGDGTTTYLFKNKKGIVLIVR